MKRVLHFIPSNDKVDFDAFDSALAKCAAIVSSRPLGPSSHDINSIQCLSPQNFLTPYLYCPEYSLDPPVTLCSADLPGTRFDVRRISDHFKERFIEEYLTALRERQKWHKVQKKFHIGQLVLIAGPDKPRTHWQIGRIDDKLPSSDTITHCYMVKTAEGSTLQRHHNTLIP